MRVNRGATAQDKLDDLRQKYAMLEDDRKAYYESSQWTIKQNKETLQLAKNENKRLRNQLATVRSSTAKGDPNEEEYKSLTTHSRILRKRYDECHTEVLKLTRHLERLRDSTMDLQRDAVRPTDEDSPQMRYIRLLENRLDKALIKYNEAHSIRKTYEQIVRRLREDRINFDNQLEQIEKTLRARETDLGELVLMSHDANHAREVAKMELHGIEDQVQSERALRAKELTEKRQQMKAKKELHAKIRLREKEKQEALTEARKKTEQELKDAERMQRELKSAAYNSELQKITTYEEGFNKVKQSTGLSDVNDIVSKCLSQDEVKHNLRNNVKEAQSRVEQQLEEKAMLKSKLEEMKYTGTASSANHKLIDTIERDLHSETNGLVKLRDKYELSAKVMIEMKTGVMHLLEKLDAVKIKDEHVYQGMMGSNMLLPSENDNIGELMQVCEAKMLKALEYVQEDEYGRVSTTNYENAEPGPGNMRVFIAKDPEEDLESEEEGSILDREAMKQESHNKVFKAKHSKRKSTHAGRH